ncbi:MAG: 4-(cytidine 5'-diphospho)-2-C-methyl-D-erythritol kinase [Paracoccaceae bacterium]
MTEDPDANVVPFAPRRSGAPAPRLARAKVNLFLHLRGRREDGYHRLDSLVVFPEIGDVLACENGPGLGLTLGGPFGFDLPSDGDNLVLRAAERLAAATGQARPRAALHLAKNLPVASGIGGGSTDAAVALDLLAEAWGVRVPDDLALALGADVPVCRRQPRPTRMTGIGETLEDVPALPSVWMVLANPLVQVETRAVFAATPGKHGTPTPPWPEGGFDDAAALVDWLGDTANDLAPGAVRVCPSVGAVLDTLADAPFARMSGSGATCFALHADEAAALDQADALRRAHPGWWVAAARCG